MRRECKIEVSEDNGIATIAVLGDLTASAEKDMDDAYLKARSYNPEKIMLKFDGKSRINSAGIAIVINLVMAGRESEREVFITGVSRHFRKIFDLVGLTKYTTVSEVAEEAS